MVGILRTKSLDEVTDSYRVEVFTHSKEAKELREALASDPSCKLKEHAHGGGSIFLFTAPMSMREYFFQKFGMEKWFCMEGSITRNLETWEIES